MVGAKTVGRTRHLSSGSAKARAKPAWRLADLSSGDTAETSG